MFSFQHFQFAGIHAGIQSGHSWIQMAVDYNHNLRDLNTKEKKARKIFWEWARDYRTVSIRNGGDQNGLYKILDIIHSYDNPYPWAKWFEDSSCNHCLTCVSIVIPESVYAWKPEGLARLDIRTQGEYINSLGKFDHKLYELIKKTKHAL